MARLQYQFRPLSNWIGPRKAKKAGQFRARWDETIKLLGSELAHLGARNVVIQADVDERDLRLDGMLRADAKPRSPAVVLSFDSKHGPLSYPCVQYQDWRDNVRAIALSLQALRAVDRYGVTRKAEQYKGWQSLPSPKAPDEPASVEAAAVHLAAIARVGATYILAARAQCDHAYRIASVETHPDVNGGDSSQFKLVEAAYRFICEHHFRD